ncbi:beta-phosphoglucomutase [Paenibacillus sp. p3-SID867]|uniref:beta-phosphoglucomutase n=1 Tax=Paenibacillus sp. p3-SID867 TaxID=2916363 RepID=UPI0021A77B03|nr:beta-phosphoglucomutase [Paenibacillus sp. p3-SID867]MCT1399733.1 beta-phosphoglucomutase [Paenibacillus sp. p3-SID867]
MSNLTACLFDLDGVLVDTAKYHYIAWKRLAGELGFEFTEQDNERLKGVSRMASLDILLEVGGITLDEDAKLALAEKKNAWYVEYISNMDESEILPGAREFIQALKDRGIKVALGSASKNAMLILNNTGLTPYFDAIIDGTKTAQAKPDPEVFTLGARELGARPDDCVVFEDAEAGIEAAIRAGMRSVGIGSPETLGRANIVLPSLEGFTVDRLLEL